MSKRPRLKDEQTRISQEGSETPMRAPGSDSAVASTSQALLWRVGLVSNT
jgi:hypothetical protein